MKVFVFDDTRYAFVHKKWLNDIPEYECVNVYTTLPHELLFQIDIDLYLDGYVFGEYTLIQHPIMPVFVDNLCNIHDLQKSKIVGRS